MSANRLKGLLIASMVLVNTAYADFAFHSNNNSCDSLPGHWFGSGKASNLFVGDCLYHGAGSISAVDDSGNFTAEVTVDKDQGSFLCPSHTTKYLTGVCIDGVTTIISEYGNLMGNFSQNDGSAKGTLSVGTGVSAEVEVQFQRQSF